MPLFGVHICEKIGLACPYANCYGECKAGYCLMQDDDYKQIDELNLYDMLDEEEE